MLGLAGNMFFIIGIMIILQSNQNPYLDFILFTMVVINQVILILVEYLSKWLRKVCRIWEVKSRIG